MYPSSIKISFLRVHLNTKNLYLIYCLVGYIISCNTNTDEYKCIDSFIKNIQKQADSGTILLDENVKLLYERNVDFVFLVTDKNHKFVVKITKYSKSFDQISKVITKFKHENIVDIKYNIKIKKAVIKYYNKEMSNTTNNEDKYAKIDYKDESFWQIMEYLENRLEFDSERSETEILHILYDVLKGIYHLHTNKILHLDLKLENILSTSKNNKKNYKIIDFNISLEVENEKFIYEKQRGGTYTYIAPEAFFQGNLSLKCDIFSFGVICFYLYNNIYHDIRIYNDLINFYLEKHKYKVDFDMHKARICKTCIQCEFCFYEKESNLCLICQNCKQDDCVSIDKVYYKAQAFLYRELIKGKRMNEIEYKNENSEENEGFLVNKRKKNNETIYIKLKKKIKEVCRIQMDKKINDMMIFCLNEFDSRPDIEHLIKFAEEKKVFGSLFKNEDFSNLF